MRYLEHDEADDPIVSVVNIVDIFLVVIAVLVMTLIKNPLNPFSSDDVTVIKNPGKKNMEIIVKKGKKLEHYQSTGAIGEGKGAKAGVTYKMPDGSMVYVPE